LELPFVNNPPNIRFSLALPVALTAKVWPCLRLPHVIKCAKKKNRKRLLISSEVGETFHFFNNHQTLATPASSHQHEKLLRQAFGVSFNFQTSSSRYSLFQRQRSPSTTAMSYGGYGGSRGGSNGYDFGRDSQSRGNYSSGYSNGYDNLWSRYCCEVWRSPPPPVAKSIWTAHF